MPQIDSPLRYPGGKSQLAPLVIDILRANDLFYGTYIEPFAGGAGIAWRLLLNNYVSRVVINDIDPAIFAFWWSVFKATDQLCERIDTAKVTIAEWRKQRAVYDSTRPKWLDYGFATFFLNRTNRSGIIEGGVIGGLEQTGAYPIDCRFNKDDLIRRIRRIAAYREQVSFFRLDAADFLKRVVRRAEERSLVNLDPPYYLQGPELYTNHYSADDHRRLAAQVARIRQKWMVTYDDTAETRALYAAYPCYTQELNYTAQVKRTGVELLVLDPRLAPPAGQVGTWASRNLTRD